MIRPFYIIGRNPNGVNNNPEGGKSAAQYLNEHANALEPDVNYDADKQQFYVCHDYKKNNGGNAPTLEAYLTDLVTLLQANPAFRLALIAFDVKQDYRYGDPVYSFDIMDMYAIIRRVFSQFYPGTAILTTVGEYEGIDCVLGARGKQRPNEAVGIDEHTAAEDVVGLFQSNSPGAPPIRYTFADGVSPGLLHSPVLDQAIGPLHYLPNIARGAELRDTNPSGPKIVYGWTIDTRDEIIAYLNTQHALDGVITENPQDVYNIITDPQSVYPSRFAIAQPGYNPFQGPLTA